MASKHSKMLAEERRREIAKLVRKEGSAAVEDLVRRFQVSAVTLRADLGQLAREGVLIRSYGGAIVPEEQAPRDTPLNVKRTYNHAQKIRIAAAALRFIQPRQTVILDSGTTAVELARAIKWANFEALTVVTHSVTIAQEFLNYPKISVVMIGGILRVLRGSPGRAVSPAVARRSFLPGSRRTR
jgi:DeoR family transcriptional regulator of aga operon